MSTINLLPKGYVRRRMQRRVNLISVLLLAMVIACVLGASLVTDRSKSHTLEVRDRIQKEYEQAAQLIRQMQMLEARKAAMLQTAQLTAALVERVPRSVLLAIVTNARPKGTSLLKVDLVTKAVKEENNSSQRVSQTDNTVYSNESRDAGSSQSKLAVEMAVTGLAYSDADVAEFIANLAANRLIETVDLSYSKEKLIKGALVREFQIRLSVLREADAIDIRNTLGPPTKKIKDKKSKGEKPDIENLKTTDDEVASR